MNPEKEGREKGRGKEAGEGEGEGRGRNESGLPPRISLEEKLSLFEDLWAPRIVAECNGQHIKLAKIRGEFVWHSHAEEDELFLVLKGRLRMEFRDGVVELGPGEMCVVPRGMEHRPVAEEEVHLCLIEPAGTVNTGDAGGPLTLEDPSWV
ncbi:MAG TPA: cupin domain-containing protein [Planctomycetes bacterium]|nr:cupin domain-containing protein [Planctomycetota bacterium]